MMSIEQAASPHVKTSSLSLSVQIKVELRSSAFTAAASAIIDRGATTFGIWFTFHLGIAHGADEASSDFILPS